MDDFRFSIIIIESKLKERPLDSGGGGGVNKYSGPGFSQNILASTMCENNILAPYIERISLPSLSMQIYLPSMR